MPGRFNHDEKDAIFEGGHFNGSFYVATPPGTEVAVVGLLRLRYRVHNSRNLGVSENFHRMKVEHDEFERRLTQLESYFS